MKLASLNFATVKPTVFRWLAGLMMLLACEKPVWSQESRTASEYRIKAVFVFNFAQFITWPTNVVSATNQPMIIGVVGDSPVTEALEEAVAGEVVGGRRLQIKHFAADEPVAGCNVLFIGRSEKDRIPQLLAELQGKPVLTIGEAGGFCEAGGMINFFRQEDRVRFEVNPEAANQSGIAISSKMLNLARIVSSRPQ